jgi:hypothetical protein
MCRVGTSGRLSVEALLVITFSTGAAVAQTQGAAAMKASNKSRFQFMICGLG